MKNAFCISKQVISGARFLRLSATAQSLYMHLNADADDDGVVEAFATINKVRANEQDLIQLVQSGFLVILNQNELIAYITDWVRNNKGLDNSNIYTCPVCDGKGTVDNLICPTCNGAGEITYKIKERSK